MCVLVSVLCGVQHVCDGTRWMKSNQSNRRTNNKPTDPPCTLLFTRRDVEAEKAEGLAAERDAREMAQRVAAAQRAEKEVGMLGV